MAEVSDRARWNRKYGLGEGPAHFEPQDFLVRHAGLLRPGGLALDVACGFGGNALYLADQGYTVDAVDVSEVALEAASAEAERRGLRDRVRFVQVDLDRWPVPTDRYNAIVVFFYLNRALFPRLARGLHPGGLLFQANRNRRHLKIRPDFSPDYLLEVGELRCMAEAAGLQVLHYADGTPEKDSDSFLIARRPGSPSF
ncbi:MAG: methyltransferase domain-containing protein [Anaerolineaceae bacterium]|nr:methyltransferase domain-containing protein [Anaerolineaceae bacterium]